MPAPRTYTDADCRLSTRATIAISATVLAVFLAAVLLTAWATGGDSLHADPNTSISTGV